MLSRENRVQLVALAIAFLVLVAFALAMPEDPGAAWIAVFVLVFYAVAFGGAHLYLYLTDGDGAIPQSSRGRFLVTLGIVLPLWAGGVLVQGESIASVDASLVTGALGLFAFLAYFVNEMRHGYAESQTAAGSR